jgi:hypothetical protein
MVQKMGRSYYFSLSYRKLHSKTRLDLVKLHKGRAGHTSPAPIWLHKLLLWGAKIPQMYRGGMEQWLERVHIARSAIFLC